MSKEMHPNINAAGFTVDILVAFEKRLRGRASQDNLTKSEAMTTVHELVVDFVTNVSVVLDQKFGTEEK